MTKQQKLVNDLDLIRREVQSTTNRMLVENLLKKAIHLVIPVEPRLVWFSGDKEKPYYEGKNQAINLLKHELRRLKDTTTSIEYVQFQVSGSLALLMTKFVDGFHGIELAIHEN